MIGEFKFFSKNDGAKILNVASMTNIGGIQYRRLIYNEYNDPVQRIHMGGVFPFSGDEYQFTWIPGSYVGNGYHTNDTFNTYTQTYHGSLPNFLLQYSERKILIYSIDFYGETFFLHNCITMWHFTNEEPYRNLTINAIVL
jgi:hypothetical protein